MKKRLRKKKRKGEYKVIGFFLAFQFDSSLSNNQRNELLDKFTFQAIEKNQLQFGGGGADTKWEGFCESGKNYCSVTGEDREQVIEWLKNEPLIKNYYSGPLIDLNYGNYNQQYEYEYEYEWIAKV